MERLNAFKTKANELASSSRGKLDGAKSKVPFSGKKEEEREVGSRHFATIAVKDVSTFAPPPKRVGNIPGARTEDKDKGPSTPTESEEVVPVRGRAGIGSRPTPPLPSRSRESVSTQEKASPPPRAKPTFPPKVTATPPPKLTATPPPKLTSAAGTKATAPTPALPPRRDSATAPGPSQDTAAPSLPSRESSYGQFRKAFGTATDSTQVNDLRNSLKKTVSPTTTSSSNTTTPPPRISLQDARTASGLAQKYRTDPNSLSLSDAKAGLNVANKILPPSSDKSPPNRNDLKTAASLGQKWNKDPKSMGWSDVKAGYAVANKFRPEPTQTPSASAPPTSEPQSPSEKSGVNDLKARFANISLGGMKPPVSPRPPASLEVETAVEQARSPPPVTGKRPPPPPPPKPRLSNGSSVPPPISQPTYNLSTKPVKSPSTRSASTWVPKDIPLNFESRWYCSDPMQQIPYLSSNPTKAISGSSVSASGSGYAGKMTWTYTAVFAIRWTSDLSRTFIRVSWNSDDPIRSVKGQQKHLPPPTPLSPADLEKAADLYGAAIVKFCQVNMGRQVGNGECWTLAHDALQHVQTVTTPKVMVSNGTIHGQCIYQRDGSTTLSGDLEMIRPGDIVQYLECKFERRQNGRVVYSSSAGAPDHTSYFPEINCAYNSVVTGKRGGVVDILHQNVGGVRKVQKGELIVDELISGKIWIYRPVWDTWAGSLEPKWENGW